jgi:hypothetical protein
MRLKRINSLLSELLSQDELERLTKSKSRGE